MVLIRNLLLTIAIESFVAWMLHVQDAKHFFRFALINTATNLPANLLFRLYARSVSTIPALQAGGLVMEAAIILIEAFLIRRFMRELPVAPLTLSFYANLLSMLVGMLLQVL